MQPTQFINIVSTVPLVAPKVLKTELPITRATTKTVLDNRETIQRILAGEDRRVLVVVGPCSIHDPKAAFEYAQRLKGLADKVAERMLLVMRVYFEKPRTTVGWKGLINDPYLNDSFDIQAGLRLARKLLLDIGDLGLPAATELLEPITPQYIADLLTLASIGARTTESPTHRQMASGLSMPVGYKNGTDGGLQVAIDAMIAGRTPHAFLGIDGDGHTCIVNTRGNPWGHLILRGGRSGPNYSPEQVQAAAEALSDAKLSPRMLVDCSHANSNKDYRNQPSVWHEVIAQRIAGNQNIIGLMLESNLHPGNQKLTADHSLLHYGVSITDGCIAWDETEALILEANDKLAE
ncbi:MAG: 3-deoxy-7-phosphoheptulonate synthase [Planctomycetota bacterium]|nr:MAG: 3-deoxy-7-phosphoheptulonate synthase [Planctomycetota bacterium]GDY10758.1 phospho-2-dehydro-3-deoxyheptonate aldolase [Planctomycetia bacterium]